MAKQGRPKTAVPMDMVDVACQFGATANQVIEALALKGQRISEDTLSRHIKAEYGVTFAEYRDKKLDLTRLKLTQKAIKMGSDGNVTMLIFCLKNLCGWKDRYDVDPAETGGITIRMAYDPTKRKGTNEQREAGTEDDKQRHDA